MKSELYKLVRDRQSRALVVIYFLFSLTTLVSPNLTLSESAAGELLNIFTVDFGMIFIMVTIIAITVFSLDYTENTLKDILPYHSIKAIFAWKWCTTIIAALAMLVFCYALSVTYSLVVARDVASGYAFLNLAKRFFAHFIIIVVNISFVIFVASFLRQRYLINAVVLVSLLITRFLPIGRGRFLFLLLSEQYAWGVHMQTSFALLSLFIICIFMVLGYYVFSKRGTE